MPATRRTKPLYQRGAFRLYPGRGSALEIIWYDDQRKRERSRSAGTGDVDAARAEVDRLYLESTKGGAFCRTCGQHRGAGSVLVMTAIADYLTMAREKPSFGSIRPRLQHVLNYLVDRGQTGARCDQIDEQWVRRFRLWLGQQPIMLPSGEKRERAISTTENSVLQLRAAIEAYGGTRPLFTALQPKEVNRTPQHRSDVPELVRMFRYCLYPEARTGKELVRRRREREHLLAFLRISVATMARPDAAHDVSTESRRKQWSSTQRVLSLNPAGRRQTRKYRATVPIARQVVPMLDDCDGFLIPTGSVENAWSSMAKALGLPGRGESGMKLIRRSIAHLCRARLPEEAWGEVSVFLGHDRFDDTSDLYAPFSPTYLRRVLRAIEDLIDEIEAGCPGAFYRSLTGAAPNVVSIAGAKS